MPSEWARRASGGARKQERVTDIGMPEQDGYSLLAQVRAWEARNGIAAPLPALALTAYAREADQRQALDAGFQAHLGKPVEPETLVNSVAALVGRSGK